MADLVRSNLEPIEESDLNFENRIKGENFNNDNSLEKPLFDVEKERALEINAGEKDSAYDEVLSKIQASPNNDNGSIAIDALDASKKIDAQSQVQHLIDLATQKGVIHAVKVAKHLDDNFILDSFHDKLLADELNEALLKKGMIEKI